MKNLINYVKKLVSVFFKENNSGVIFMQSNEVVVMHLILGFFVYKCWYAFGDENEQTIFWKLIEALKEGATIVEIDPDALPSIESSQLEEYANSEAQNKKDIRKN